MIFNWYSYNPRYTNSVLKIVKFTFQGKTFYANHAYSIIKYDKKRNLIMKKPDKIIYGKSNLRIIDANSKMKDCSCRDYNLFK